MNRAYSILTVKAVKEDQRIITGTATSPMPDRVGDIVEPLGVQFKNPLPLLWQHQSDMPVGTVTFDKPTKNGINFTAKLPKPQISDVLKARVDEAWESIKLKLVSGVSIGFRPIEMSMLDNGGMRFISSEVLELSLVTVPANADATIQTVKSIDSAQRKQMGDMPMMAPASDEAQSDFMDRCVAHMLNMSDGMTQSQASAHCSVIWDAGPPAKKLSGTKQKAASGQIQQGVVRLHPPGATGFPKHIPKRQVDEMKTLAEQITALEAKRAANTARMEEVMQKSIADGRSTEEAEQEEFDTLETEVDTIDKDLKRLKTLERVKAVSARPVIEVTDEPSGIEVRSGISVKAPPKLAPGVAFAQYTKCMALAAKMYRDPAQVAEQLYGPNSIVVGALKASVGAGDNVSGNWAANLVGSETSLFADFVEFLRPKTIVGRFGTNGIPALRNVPFRTPLITQSAAGAGYWVGEGKAKPLTSVNFTRTTLVPLKVANIAVLTEESIRDSNPKSDVIVRDELVMALQSRLDQDFIDPAKTASAGVSPASITNGAQSITSTGTDADAARLDLRALFDVFDRADNPPESAVLIMAPRVARGLAGTYTDLGIRAFPNIGIVGGEIDGTPVIVSRYVDDKVVLVNASDIYLGDEGGVSVDMSREASLEMSDAPTHDSRTPTGASLVSMFQTNSVAIRAERTINWARRRTASVAYLSGVQWGGDLPTV